MNAKAIKKTINDENLSKKKERLVNLLAKLNVATKSEDNYYVNLSISEHKELVSTLSEVIDNIINEIG